MNGQEESERAFRPRPGLTLGKEGGRKMGRRAEDQRPQWSFRKPVPTQWGAPGSLSQSVMGRAWSHIKYWMDLGGIAAGNIQSADYSPPSRFSPEGT